MIVPDLEKNNCQSMNTASLNVKDEFLQASEVTKIFLFQIPNKKAIS